ncbi:hypothetical protein [Endothiovibrio diazotrophicus]
MRIRENDRRGLDESLPPASVTSVAAGETEARVEKRRSATGLAWLLFRVARPLGFEALGERIHPMVTLAYFCTLLHY